MNGFQYEIEFRGLLLFNLLEGTLAVYPRYLRSTDNVYKEVGAAKEGQ